MCDFLFGMCYLQVGAWLHRFMDVDVDVGVDVGLGVNADVDVDVDVDVGVGGWVHERKSFFFFSRKEFIRFS